LKGATGVFAGQRNPARHPTIPIGVVVVEEQYDPAGQFRQAVAEAAEYFPVPQGVGVMVASAAQKYPSGQAPQLVPVLNNPSKTVPS
jgi:hypothetical protein